VRKRITLEETGVQTVKGDKITRERIFYGNWGRIFSIGSGAFRRSFGFRGNPVSKRAGPSSLIGHLPAGVFREVL
jgi:hypothetical protein